MVGGVFGGLGSCYGFDPTFLRIAYVTVYALGMAYENPLSSAVFWIYCILWACIRSE